MTFLGIFKCLFLSLLLFSGCKEDPLYIKLHTNVLTFECDGEGQTIKISSNGEWTIFGETSWCKVSTKTGNGDLDITVTVSENQSLEERMTTLIFICGSDVTAVEITQLPKRNIGSDTKVLVFEHIGGIQTIIVSSNGEWTISGETDWCEVSPKTGNRDLTVSITVSENYSSEERIATLIFTYGTETVNVEVTQEKKYIKLNLNALTFQYDGGSQKVTVSSNAKWTVSGETDWCEVSSKTGDGNLSVTVTVLENELPNERNTKLIFVCGTEIAEVEIAQVKKREDEVKWVLINGVKWATCNIGIPGTFAATPEKYGKYFQWNKGTTDFMLYDDYYKSDYPKSTSWLPANDPSPEGYRLPTLEEIQSLLNTTYVINERITQYGVVGQKFTDKKSGESIFIPFAGYLSPQDGVLYQSSPYNYYWSSTRYGGNYTFLYLLNSLLNADVMWGNKNYDNIGFPIRSVAKE